MKYRNLLFVVILFSSILLGMIGEMGCASIVPPAGGPKDSFPPVLRHASPPDSTIHFSNNRINFTFDEYIDLDNPQQNLIVSPIPTSFPTVTRKLNTLNVHLKDSLEPNTTYTLNFGNSIKDVNEGNVFKDFTYVFSTGSYLDSLELTGKVILAENGEIDSTLTVILHKHGDDSAVIKEKPRYITRLDGQGNFHFKTLPKGSFYIYALKDQGGGYRYMNPENLFAFADSAVVTGSGSEPVTLYAYSVPKKQVPPPANTSNKGVKTEKRLKFSTSLAQGTQDLLKKFSFHFETPLKNFDSTKLHFAEDSSFIPVPGYTWELDSTMSTATLHYDWKENTLYHFILEKDFATDTLNLQLLKPDTISFRSYKTSDYGKLSIRFKNIDVTTNPVLLFVQNNQIVNTFPLSSLNFSLPMITPGEYNLRILQDKNKNGQWDAGEFFGKHLQPELVKPIQRKITIKPNWENEFEIDADAAPEPINPGFTNPAGRQEGRRPIGR